MLKDCVDLHCHSTASDGRLTPQKLVERATQMGLRALALTDHDTIGGLAALHAAAKGTTLETISGVEISADYTKGTLHIVGLFVDAANESFRAFLKKLADGRNVRNPLIVEKLRALGFEITMKEVEDEAGIGAEGGGGGAIDKSIGRPHISAVLIKKGFVRSKQEAFDKYLAKGQPAYVTRFVASPEESIAQIHSSGGIAVLAHPTYLKAESAVEMERIIGDLKSKGLDGIEVQYSTHTPEQTELCAGLAKKFDLTPSGGSDFHGETGRSGRSVELGTGIAGTLAIPCRVLDGLKARQARRLERN